MRSNKCRPPLATNTQQTTIYAISLCPSRAPAPPPHPSLSLSVFLYSSSAIPIVPPTSHLTIRSPVTSQQSPGRQLPGQRHRTNRPAAQLNRNALSLPLFPSTRPPHLARPAPPNPPPMPSHSPPLTPAAPAAALTPFLPPPRHPLHPTPPVSLATSRLSPSVPAPRSRERRC